MAHMLQVFTCIYLHATHKFEPKVGKYSSPMEHVGYVQLYMGVSKNSGTPKMDALFHGNPKKWMIWGGKPTIFGNIHITISTWYFFFIGALPRGAPLLFHATLWLPDWRCIAGVARKNPGLGGKGMVKVNQQLKIPSPCLTRNVIY